MFKRTCENYSLICTVLAICCASLHLTKGAQQEALKIKRKVISQPFENDPAPHQTRGSRQEALMEVRALGMRGEKKNMELIVCICQPVAYRGAA